MGGTSSSVPLEGPEYDFIKSEISSNCVVVFSKTSCPYCGSTKRLFNEMGVTPTVIELDRRQDGGQLQDVLNTMTGARTVPRVFINGECIGGNSETQSLKRSGQLEAKIKSCAS